MLASQYSMRIKYGIQSLREIILWMKMERFGGGTYYIIEVKGYI